jgi:dynein assembly factor 6, axonemal
LHTKADKDKEIAKPNAQIEVKTFNRDAKGGATEDALLKAREALKLAQPKNQIWNDEEIAIQAEQVLDDRAEPEYDIIQKQHVGTEDVFLGLSDRDASSTHCDCILLKVWLPNTKFSQVQLDVKNGQVIVQSPHFVLNKLLPYQVDKENGKAKFDSDKFLLEVTLPVKNRHILDRLDD